MRPSKENDKVRKQFTKVYSPPDFPLFNSKEMWQLEQLIANYNDFKEDDKEHVYLHHQNYKRTDGSVNSVIFCYIQKHIDEKRNDKETERT